MSKRRKLDAPAPDHLHIKRWVLFLRGVNVGGSGRLPMDSLRAILGELGCMDVSTYIQSGNAVFRSSKTPAELSAGVSSGILSKHAFEPAVLILTLAVLADAVSTCPFLEDGEPSSSAHLFFFGRNYVYGVDKGGGASAPEVDEAAICARLAADESLELRSGVAYLHAPSGIGRSKIAQSLPKLLPGPVTARNMRSCIAVRDLAMKLG